MLCDAFFGARVVADRASPVTHAGIIEQMWEMYWLDEGKVKIKHQSEDVDKHAVHYLLGFITHYSGMNVQAHISYIQQLCISFTILLPTCLLQPVVIHRSLNNAHRLDKLRDCHQLRLNRNSQPYGRA